MPKRHESFTHEGVSKTAMSEPYNYFMNYVGVCRSAPAGFTRFVKKLVFRLPVLYERLKACYFAR